ncbi:MAG: 30S ribosomal protein S12 methylthiotransferase RimO, partial [Elusimicrobiales bacterium]
MKRFHLVSLGCPKNLVDSERIADIFVRNGYIFTSEIECDVVIINTCSFLSSATRESDRVIKKFIDFKKKGAIKKVVVAGCMVSRYKQSILKRYPDVDAFVDVESLDGLERFVTTRSSQRLISTSSYFHHSSRFLLTKNHVAYLKISEGCNNMCSYCVIPNIRGYFRSRNIEELIAEAKALADCGVRELVLISQDTLRYGSDIYGKKSIISLIERLEKIPSLSWIRLMYLYPSEICRDLIEYMKNSKKLLPYFDIPLQHASSKILRLMNRRYDEVMMRDLLDMIFSEIKDAAVRTNFIVGFPYETESDFRKVVRIIDDYPFAYVNLFKYSREKGSSSYFFKQIPSNIKNERYKILLSKASIKLNELNRKIQGRDFVVIADSQRCARSYMDAPDIDGIFETDRDMRLGCFYRVNVVSAYG